jgi:hypothetical protein
MIMTRSREPLFLAIASLLALALVSQFVLDGPARLLGPALYLLAGSASLVSLFYGKLSDRLVGAALIVLLLAASYYTLGIGECALFILATGLWFYAGIPLSILLYLGVRIRSRVRARSE